MMLNLGSRVMPLEELIPAIEVDPNSVTPGVIGFVFTFVIAGAVFLDPGHGPQSPQGSLP